MDFFLQMGEYQALPAAVQHILAAPGGKLKPASPFPWFQQQMDLRIMTQGFKMPHAFYRPGNSLFIDYIACPKFHLDPKPLRYQAF